MLWSRCDHNGTARGGVRYGRDGVRAGGRGARPARFARRPRPSERGGVRAGREGGRGGDGPAMSDYILNTTDIHSVRKYTMVQPCLFTSVTSPTSTFSAKIQWSGQGRLHPYHNRHSPRPQKYDGPALSRNMPQTTDIIHVVHKNRGFGHVRMQPSRLRHPPSPQKYNGLAMSGYNLNTTDIQLK